MKQTMISRVLHKSAIRLTTVAGICMMMLLSAAAPATAQRHSGDRTEHRDNKGGKREHSNRNSKGGRDNRKASPDKKRPERPAQAAPGNNNHHNNKRPDNRHPEGNRPKPSGPHNNNNNQAYRPGATGANRLPAGNPRPAPAPSLRPGDNVRPAGPAHNWKPGAPNKVHPGHTIHRPPVAPPPPRPMRPAHFIGFNRPVPPPAWRPGPRPLFSTVLGLTFGTAINATINALISGGYTVDGYTDNMVYINDAVQLNMRWPFGVLLYNNGVLSGSEFTYSSDWRDLNRYNMAFARLSSLYGPPVSRSNRNGELSATWWGPGGQYVNLRFDYRAPVMGNNRYYTTLSFGI